MFLLQSVLRKVLGETSGPPTAQQHMPSKAVTVGGRPFSSTSTFSLVPNPHQLLHTQDPWQEVSEITDTSQVHQGGVNS